ncbi:DUF829-domain-containing protein [Durotheca rogersii]|uniref:DUF829-domain-containing protein n=1 Tax=Durotheca rogersii TaxID=419775 RepID=UPI00221EDE7F|nr:DUF829-domain-containing protein [Durotheca rogersii]KAI5863658.1 DUF829-domain-containing protein [Durotheca rogersii]
MSALPGFTPISDRIFLRDGAPGPVAEPPSDSAADHPTTIIIFGWGDGLPKHVSKYADGYHKLYPKARVLMVISSIFAAIYDSLEQRTKSMIPIIDTVFPVAADDARERVLLHTMSNTGGIYAAAALNAFKQRHGEDKALPHFLSVSDSTPGGLEFSTEVGRWSRAMALGTAKWFPWPFAVTQGLWWAFLHTVNLIETAVGREPSGKYSCRVFLENSMATPRAPRLYMYSKADDLIGWEDVEAHAAVAQSRGYTTVLERFDNSPHVGHMRMHPERYWNAIERCWKASMALEAKS